MGPEEPRSQGSPYRGGSRGREQRRVRACVRACVCLCVCVCLGEGVVLGKEGGTKISRFPPVGTALLYHPSIPSPKSELPPLASRCLLQSLGGAVRGDNLAVPPKETECSESCSVAGEALKYLEPETTAHCPVQACWSRNTRVPENIRKRRAWPPPRQRALRSRQSWRARQSDPPSASSLSLGTSGLHPLPP